MVEKTILIIGFIMILMIITISVSFILSQLKEIILMMRNISTIIFDIQEKNKNINYSSDRTKDKVFEDIIPKLDRLVEASKSGEL